MKTYLITLTLLSALFFIGCNKDGPIESPTNLPVNPSPQSSLQKSDIQSITLKKEEIKSYLTTIVQDLAKKYLPEIQKQEKNTISLKDIGYTNSYITMEEKNHLYEIEIYKFDGSDNRSEKVYFALDPDRFYNDGKMLAYSSTGETIEIESINSKTVLPYNLYLIDIKRYISPEEELQILNAQIQKSSAYAELGIFSTKNMVECGDCGGDGGGGGGGGGTSTPRPWLVLKSIKLKYDLDGGNDECELYIREDDVLMNSPGEYTQAYTNLRFDGGNHYDNAGRLRRMADMNNNGNEDTGMDVALWPLTDTRPVSFVGIEDDDGPGQYESSASNPRTMFEEYRRTTNTVVSNISRGFTKASGSVWDSDDIWDRSHCAYFTASNMTVGVPVVISIGHFDFTVVREDF